MKSMFQNEFNNFMSSNEEHIYLLNAVGFLEEVTLNLIAFEKEVELEVKVEFDSSGNIIDMDVKEKNGNEVRLLADNIVSELNCYTKKEDIYNNLLLVIGTVGWKQFLHKKIQSDNEIEKALAKLAI
tara:strand:- start:2062 stop:2442 length:381 start_codon:yes stop_codon:yes gene_type:complete